MKFQPMNENSFISHEVDHHNWAGMRPLKVLILFCMLYIGACVPVLIFSKFTGTCRARMLSPEIRYHELVPFYYLSLSRELIAVEEKFGRPDDDCPDVAKCSKRLIAEQAHNSYKLKTASLLT
jgi:hypothetical protein